MGHDYIDFQDRHVRLSDWDIWTLRHFFSNVAKEAIASDLETDEATVESLRSFLESWEWLGPGVVTGTNLSEFVADQPDRANVLLLLFQRTAHLLCKFGDVIPLEYLVEHVNSPNAYYTASQPTSRFIEALEALQKLVQES